MTLVLRKLLASSSFAISGTFRKLEYKLEEILLLQADKEDQWEAYLEVEYEDLDELKDEWEENGEQETKTQNWFSPQELDEIREEANLLKSFAELAESIQINSKGEKLAVALEAGFSEAVVRGATKKAIIFTESRRTQQYLYELLALKGYSGKIVLFNGTNSDKDSKGLYYKWLAKNKGSDRITGSPTADMRAALVDEFKENAEIMIATEAAAEGINLQFCSIVVNYDMLWNPQRIEQRIGRCHRYGQKNDVVVINFLNKRNAADERVYNLLNEKFNLFNGVFGASDEVLGSIESGVDIERRIAQIYQECRTEEEINESFNLLQHELEESIHQEISTTKQKLLENFDEEVHEKLKINLAQSKEYISKYEGLLWKLSKFYLQKNADFNDESLSFDLHESPFHGVDLGKYKLGRNESNHHYHYRIQHPLAQVMIQQIKLNPLSIAEITFEYGSTPILITALESFIGTSGWLQLSNLTIKSFQEEDHIILTGFTDQGERLPSDLLPRLFSLGANVKGEATIQSDTVEELMRLTQEEANRKKDEAMNRDSIFFHEEYEKLDHWADDMKISLEKELLDLDAEIKLKKSEARRIVELKTKVAAQREIKEKEKERNEKRKKLFESQDQIDQQKEKLLSDVENQLEQRENLKDLFTIRWEII